MAILVILTYVVDHLLEEVVIEIVLWWFQARRERFETTRSFNKR